MNYELLKCIFGEGVVDRNMKVPTVNYICVKKTLSAHLKGD